jgi:hypothetical protein
VLGLVVTYLYDKRGLDRIEGDLLAYINRSADEYIQGKQQQVTAEGATPSTAS